MKRPKPRPRTIVDEIVGTLSAEILSGSREPGERMPGYRTLNERFDVTMPTTQRAMAKLEEMGLVDIRQGRGATVLEPRSSARPGALPFWLEALRGTPERAGRLVDDFLELRRDLAIKVVLRYRRESDREQLDALRDLTLELARVVEDGSPIETIVEADIAIPQEMLRVIDQLAYATMFNAFARLLRELPDLQTAMYSSPTHNVRGWDAAIRLIDAPSDISDEDIEEQLRAALREIDRHTVDQFVTILERS